MSYTCPTCGVEFADINECLRHREASVRRSLEREKSARVEAAYRALELRQDEGPSLGPTVGGGMLDPPPPRPSADPGESFLRKFGGRRG